MPTQVEWLTGGWAGRLPSPLSWRRNWARITPFFDYPPAIRKVIDTTNASDSINMSLRKVSKIRASFPRHLAVSKLFYLTLNNLSKKWSIPIRDSKAARNRFAIEFEDRLLPV
jgi:putative transposase